MPGAPAALSNSVVNHSEEELLADRYLTSSWLRYFRPCTSRTRLVSLSSSFVSSLLANTLQISSPTTRIEWSDGTIDQEDNEDETNAPPTAIEQTIATAISELGGAVSPKINATAPTDATWANFHRSTKCTSVSDVYTLISSSERLLEALSPDKPATLVLRQWADFDNRLEFRVFVRDGVVVAACPRGNDIEEMSQETMDRYMDVIVRWIMNVAISRIGNTFVVDLYLERGHRVWLVDFAKWGPPTNPILFQWTELSRAPWLRTGRPQMRVFVSEDIRVNGNEVGLPVELRGSEGMRRVVEAARTLYREQDEESNSEEE